MLATQGKRVRLALLMVVLFGGMVGLSHASTARAPQAAHRIVVLFPQVMGAVYLLGLQNMVIGVPMAKLRLDEAGDDGFFVRYAPDIKKATDVGFPGKPNMETLFALNPTLVLSTDETVHPTPANKILRENGITVLALKGGFGNIEDWLGAVRQIASATGRETRALAYEGFFRERIRLVRDRLRMIPEDARPRVALVNTNAGQLVIRGSRTRFGHELIRLAGGRTMSLSETSDDASVCAERLFAFDPDIIIDDTTMRLLDSVSWWKSLKAVKEGRVFRTPQDDSGAWITNWCLNTFSPLGLLWLAKTFHPTTFADIDLEAERNRFYRDVLGVDFRPFPKHAPQPE
jgi:iron complex transport system substrate-binding protein